MGDAKTGSARTAILLGLVFLAVTALRGRMPEARPSASDQSADSSPVTLAGILLLLSASMLIVAVALLTRPPRQEPPTGVEERTFPGGTGPWPIRRLMLLALGVVVAAMAAFLVLNQVQHLPLPWTAEPPEPPQAPPGAPPNGPPGTRRLPDDAAANEVLTYLAVAVATMAVLMAASAVLARLRRRSTAPVVTSVDVAASAPVGPEPLVVAAERGLAEVADLRRGPREAIIACYVAMEEALASTPGSAPLESDTPSEVLARAVTARALRADNAATLVELFAEARFSTHTMTETHRETAERALRTVLGELLASAGSAP